MIMKKIIYILILITAFIFNMELRAEWIEKDGFFYMKDSLDAIRDFKVSDDGEIIAITKDNQIIKYDFETGEIKKRCKCEGDENYNKFAFVSKDLKTTSIVYNFDTLNNENVAYNLAIINNDDCSRIVNQKMDIPEKYRVSDRYFNFSFIDYISKANILILSKNIFKFGSDDIWIGNQPRVTPHTLKGITMSFELLYSKDHTMLLLIDSIDINSYSYQINNNEIFFSGFNLFIRDELAHQYTFANGHQSKFCKINLNNGKFETIQEFNYFVSQGTKEFNENDKYFSYMVENDENKVFLISNRKYISPEGYYEKDNQLHEYKIENNKFKYINNLFLDIDTDPYIDIDISKWQFYRILDHYKFIKSNNFTYNFKHKNGILYSNFMEDHYRLTKYNKTKFNIKDFQNYKTLDSFFIDFDYKKVEVFIPKSYNQFGGALILKENIICLKKNKYFNNIIKDYFGINKSIIREGESFNLNSHTNNETLKYKWSIYNEFNQYSFETNNRNFDCIIPQSGKYSINLKILNNDSLIANTTKDTILTVYPKIKADFEIKIDKQYQDIFYLSNRSLGKITKYEWTLDNGVKSNEQNITFRKYNETDFNIKLKIYDDLGVDSIVKSINLSNQLIFKFSKIDSVVENSNNEFMDLVIDKDNLVISSIKSTWKSTIFYSSFNYEYNYQVNFEKKIINLNNSTFNLISNIFEGSVYIDISGKYREFIFGTGYYITSLMSKFKETKNNTDLIFLNNNLTIKKRKPFAYLTKNNSCVLNDSLYFGLSKRTNNNNKFPNDTLNLIIYNFKTLYKDLGNYLPVNYKVGKTYADNINNQIVGLIRKDSSNKFEIFETNEKLEINRRDFSLPFDMEINEIKLTSVNKLAIVGHKKHQYTKGIGTIVIVDLRDLSFVVKEHNSRPTINNLRKINESYYYAFGDVIGSQGYIIFDKNFDLVKDIRLTDLEGELKDVEYTDNKFYLATEAHYLDTISPFRIEDKYKIRLFMDSIEVDLSEDITSVETNSESNFLIFPNPSSDKISVDLGEVIGVGGVVDLSIYDILGNEMMTIPNYASKTEIDVSNLSIGTYTIQIQTPTGSVSQRLLVNR